MKKASVAKEKPAKKPGRKPMTAEEIVKLADVLGHSSVETTRIYLISTGDEHARQIERLRLVS